MGNLIRSAFVVLLALMGLGNTPAAGQYKPGYEESRRGLHSHGQQWHGQQWHSPPQQRIIVIPQPQVVVPSQQFWGGNRWVQPQQPFNLNLQVSPPPVQRAPDGLGDEWLAENPRPFCARNGGTLYRQYRWTPRGWGRQVVSPACVRGLTVIAYRGPSGWWWWPQ